jgi:Protein of unknown function (DUF998)
VLDRRAWGILAVSVLGAFFYANFILDLILPGEHDWRTLVSELEKPGYPHAGLLRSTDVVCGLLVLALTPLLWTALPAGRRRGWSVGFLAAFAIGNAVAGAVPLPDGSSGGTAQLQQLVHDVASAISQAALFLGAITVAIGTRRRGPQWLHRSAWATFWVGGVVASIIFGSAALADSDSWQTGAAQRFQLSVSGIWIVCLGYFCATAGLAGWDRSRSPAVADEPVADTSGRRA